MPQSGARKGKFYGLRWIRLVHSPPSGESCGCSRADSEASGAVTGTVSVLNLPAEIMVSSDQVAPPLVEERVLVSHSGVWRESIHAMRTWPAAPAAMMGRAWRTLASAFETPVRADQLSPCVVEDAKYTRSGLPPMLDVQSA